MLILTHPETNARHGKPEGWDDERNGVCATLPTISVGVIHASFWQPEPHELEILKAGGCVALHVIAAQHPVVSVSVEAWPEQRHSSDGTPIDA